MDGNAEFYCDCGQQLPLKHCDGSSKCLDYSCVSCGQEHNALFDLKSPEELWTRVRLAEGG